MSPATVAIAPVEASSCLAVAMQEVFVLVFPSTPRLPTEGCKQPFLSDHELKVSVLFFFGTKSGHHQSFRQVMSAWLIRLYKLLVGGFNPFEKY